MIDDWNKKEKRSNARVGPPRTSHATRLPEIRECLVCGTPFHPWPKGPGECCSRPCAGRLSLSRRKPERMGALYRFERSK